MEYFWLILTGMTAGWLARQSMTGKGFGMIGDLIAGVVGALTGGVLFEKSGIFIGSGFIESLIVATTGAVACLYGVRMLKKWRIQPMAKILKICSAFTFVLSLLVLFGMSAAIAQEDLLDGRVFVGQSIEKHKKGASGDELRFVKGEFHSIGHAQKGFLEGVYTARAEGGTIYFEAETLNPEQGKIMWSGIVRGNSIEVNYSWRKKGWFSDTEKNYSFKGELKQ